MRVVIVASGEAYQQAAAFSARTYLTKSPNVEVFVLVPEGEPISNELLDGHEKNGFNLERFPFRQISERKFTSQLKCQAFVHALSMAFKGELVALVDADTCCLQKILVPPEAAQRLKNGSIAMVPDIEDRHFTCPNDPWYLTENERLAYVNSGVILATATSLSMFRRFRSLSEQSRFLHGPFNDQKVINFALGKYFRDRLVMLEKKYNFIGPPFPTATIIAHFAGGAGYLGQQRRKLLHESFCTDAINGDPPIKQKKEGRVSEPPRR